MNLKDYFEKQQGSGVMSTADASGQVNAAIYARPHILEDGSLAMIMLGRLTYTNLKNNPYAHYLFIEKGDGYKGVRLSLKKIKEDTNPELIQKLRRHPPTAQEQSAPGERYIVYFEIKKALQLIGDQPFDLA
jgi:hypothetical protein